MYLNYKLHDSKFRISVNCTYTSIMFNICECIYHTFLIGFHFYCAKLLKAFARDDNQHPEKFYRLINEIPTVILIAVIILVYVRPF